MRAMTRFVVESDFRKLASSDTSSSLLALWSVMSTVGVVTRVGANVRPDAAEPMRGTGEPVCEMSCVRAVLPEKERRTAGASSGVPQDMVGSMSVREEQEPSSYRSHCIDGSNLCDHIRTLGTRNDKEHCRGWDGVVARTKGNGETFSEGVSLTDANVSIG